MTYQLRIGERFPGETDEQAAARLSGETESEEIAPDPFEIRRVGNLLAETVPNLQRSDAPKGWTLTHPGSGAQIRMSGDEFGITVPPTFSSATATAVWNDLWTVIKALHQEGYAAYDPQLGRILNPEHDLDAVIGKYSGPTPERQTATAAPAAPQKPWWKLW